eukprot:snap_masked-scaffold1452_size40707-processed-gene-0.5 protein:Tk02615 transcript:snap_masked-scaffold1452_size40707-processed-gene-0.5-mRNA-1 annotation:"protein serac1"
MTKFKSLVPPARWSQVGKASGLVIGSGYLAWQLFRGGSPPQDGLPVFQDSSLTPDFLPLPASVVAKFNALDPIDAKEELKSMIPKHLKKPWKLLRQANWGSYEAHLTAVRELARLKLSDGECRQIAQSCARHTAIGLARTPGVDERLFVPPAPIPPRIEQTTTPQLFKAILLALPKQAVHKCIDTTTLNALENYVPGTDEALTHDSDLDHEFQRDSHHWVSLPRTQYSEKTAVQYCLQALLSHSILHSHCQSMLQSGLLPVLTKIVREYPHDAKLKSLIGKILANISLHEDCHEAIFASGWVGLLARWKQDPNLLVTLPATKALCNLDQKFGHVYQPGIYLLLPEHRDVRHLNELSNWGVDIVFIHGLLGGVFYSWRQLDAQNERGWGTPDLISSEDYSYCWPRDWLSVFGDNIRVLGVDFDTYLSQWGNTCPSESFKSSLSERSLDIFEKLKSSGVGRRPVIFVGHSMGGLMVKKMLTHAQQSPLEEDRQFALQTKGIVFYGTPHAGSRIAKLNSATKFFFFPSVELQDLEADSPRLAELHQSFLDWARTSSSALVSFGETISTPYMGVDLTFVPPRSSNPGVGEYHLVSANHMNVCKPSGKNSILYRKLVLMIHNAMEEATPFET